MLNRAAVFSYKKSKERDMHFCGIEVLAQAKGRNNELLNHNVTNERHKPPLDTEPTDYSDLFECIRKIWLILFRTDYSS